jgi:hypothetical protein
LLVGVGSGCGDDTTSSVMDMTAAHDMSMSMVDMAKLTCAQILSCVQTCAGSTSCDANCVSEGNTAAQGYIGAFEQCLFDTCGPGDGGNDSCTGLTDTSAGCANCLNSTGTNAALGGPCSAEFSACTSH